MKKFILFLCCELIFVIIVVVVLLSNYKNYFITEKINTNKLIQLPTEVYKKIVQEKDENSIIVINVWESWCAPCIKEIPELNRLQDKFKNYKVQFIALTSSTLQDCNNIFSTKKLYFNFSKYYEKNKLITEINSIYFNGEQKQISVPQHIVINQNREIALFLEGASPENVFKIQIFLEKYANADD